MKTENDLINFANAALKKAPAFKPFVTYNEEMDRLEYFIENYSGVTDREDDLTTLVLDQPGGRIIGLYVKGPRQIYRRMKGVGIGPNDGFLDFVQLLEYLAFFYVSRFSASESGIQQMQDAYREIIGSSRKLDKVNVLALLGDDEEALLEA